MVRNFAKVEVVLPKGIALGCAIPQRLAEVYRLDPIREHNRQGIATKADRPQEKEVANSLGQIHISRFTAR